VSEERNRVLDLLANGKISAEEAARLLDAIESRSSDSGAVDKTDVAPSALPKFIYVKVNTKEKGDNVNIKIPLSLLRAGLKLTALIPSQAVDQINQRMSEHGIAMDLANLKPDDLSDLVDALREMEINVDAANGDTVRVYAA
jgi:hypothetical protein